MEKIFRFFVHLGVFVLYLTGLYHHEAFWGLSALPLLVLLSFSCAVYFFIHNAARPRVMTGSDQTIRLKACGGADSLGGTVAALCCSLFDLPISFSIFMASPDLRDTVSNMQRKLGQGCKVRGVNGALGRRKGGWIDGWQISKGADSQPASNFPWHFKFQSLLDLG